MIGDLSMSTTTRTRRQLAVGSHLLLIEGDDLLTTDTDSPFHKGTALVLKFIAIDSPSDEHDPVWLCNSINDSSLTGDYSRASAKRFYTCLNVDVWERERAVGRLIRAHVAETQTTRGSKVRQVTWEAERWSPSELGQMVERRALVLAAAEHPMADHMMAAAGRLIRADDRYVGVDFDAGTYLLRVLNG